MDVRLLARLRQHQRGLQDLRLRIRMNDGVNKLVTRAEALVERLERFLPDTGQPTDWKASIAFRWRKKNGRAAIEPVSHVHRISLKDLQGIDDQKRLIEQN